MGNEGSLPEQGGEQEFEDQARAPPSSSNPPVAPQPSTRGGRIVNAFRRNNNTPSEAADYAQRDSERIMNEQEQQQYYSQQPQQQMYPMPQQQQAMISDPYFAQTPTQTSQYTMPQQGESPVVGVMYQNNTTPKKGMNFRQGANTAGRTIINSMKNLTLTRKPSQIQRQASNGKSVNDWEKQWDEDDDDEDDEEEEQVESTDVKTPAAAQPLHRQMRPGLDAGLSSAPLSSAPLVTSTPPQKPHVVTEESIDQLKQVPDDGVEWDTGGPLEAPLDKPKVEMFLPLLRVLGKGSFGKVVLVQKRTGKESGALFAMKILRKSHLVRRRQIERTRTERKVLSVVNHPFIMKLHYAFQSPDKLYLVLDYCPGGELFFHLSRFRRFPERVARFYSAELLLALGHLHKRGIIYRDLKPENVLLDADGHVKLGDFGLAKAGIRQPCEGATSMCGTPEYMAPEVLAQQGHGFCVDYWGLGMLVYEMMTGLPPWYTTDRTKLFRRLRGAPLDIPSYFSQSSANCVSALLERNPRRRLGVTGVRAAMEHEFFRTISWRALYGRRVEAPIRPCEGWSPPDPNAQEPTTQQSVMNGDNADKLNLDAATANFDNTFTRMPVESDHDNTENDEDVSELEELNEDTFIGFTFDDNDRDEIAAVQAQAARQRTHNYDNATNGTPNPAGTRQID